MALSARNHLKGEVTEVLLGTVTALITIKVGDNAHRVGHHQAQCRRSEAQKGRQGHCRDQGHRGHGPEGLSVRARGPGADARRLCAAVRRRRRCLTLAAAAASRCTGRYAAPRLQASRPGRVERLPHPFDADAPARSRGNRRSGPCRLSNDQHRQAAVYQRHSGGRTPAPRGRAAGKGTARAPG